MEAEIKQTKKWYQSKTLWVNVLMFMSALATYTAGEVEAGNALTIASVVNFAMRFLTNTKLE